MSLQINTNVAALNAHRNLSNTQNSLSSSLEKLSSGLRINRAADDAAGLSISEGLRSQVNGMEVAARNAQDGISLIQTAEGSLTEVHDLLQRARDLAVQAGNDSNNAESRAAITSELNAIGEELTRISEGTNFNGIDLLKGGEDDALTFQVGAGATAFDTIEVKLDSISLTLEDEGVSIAGANGVLADFDVSDNAGAQTLIGQLDAAITQVSSARSELGATQNRMESAINSLNVSRENLSAAESRIRDVDMAAEMTNFTRSNILSQAGTAMLAQANQSTQGVLQLLG
ncbi:flagellin [Nesterenkonia sp. NBAIMH1]|uniref:flagellin N-terminal helical domain-containing protein n=1 Tax=Nesterenkonia sp. NBAIMH1 TaxID=2600320 RepID=UPI0011B7C7D3|nr:flagellin [Nesterenkonia sp. NBAIMH1]